MNTYTFDEQESNKFTFTPSTKLTPEVLLAISHNVDLTFVEVIGLSNYSLSELIFECESNHYQLFDFSALKRALYNQYTYFRRKYYLEYEYHCCVEQRYITDNHIYEEYATTTKNMEGLHGWLEFRYNDELKLIAYSESSGYNRTYDNGNRDGYSFDDNGNFTGYFIDDWHEITFKPSKDKNVLCSVYEDDKLILEIRLRNPK